MDLEHGKNLAGAFWQPRLVLMDPEVLDTLPLPVFMEGMAEVVKYGCIRDAAFFDFLAARPSRVELMAEMEHILYTLSLIHILWDFMRHLSRNAARALTFAA